MGDFNYSISLSNSVGLSPVPEFSTSPKSSTFCTTPSLTEPVVSQHPTMQDDLIIGKPGSKTPQSISPVTEINGDDVHKSKEDDVPNNSMNNVGFINKQNEQMQSSHPAPPMHISAQYVTDSSVGAANVWPGNLDDGMIHGIPVNGSIAYQNYQTNPQPFTTMPGLVQAQGQSPQQRRAITAQHNFPNNVPRPLPGGPNMYMNKGYPVQWSGTQQGWSPGHQQPQMQTMSPWNRGRSMSGINHVPAMSSYGGNIGRKTNPPQFNQAMMVQSPIKFRRSTSFPGKNIFPQQQQQQPTFEITNVEDNRDAMLYQVGSFLL